MERLVFDDPDLAATLFGPQNLHLDILGEASGARLFNRGNTLFIETENRHTETSLVKLLLALYEDISEGRPIDPQGLKGLFHFFEEDFATRKARREAYMAEQSAPPQKKARSRKTALLKETDDRKESKRTTKKPTVRTSASSAKTSRRGTADTGEAGEVRTEAEQRRTEAAEPLKKGGESQPGETLRPSSFSTFRRQGGMAPSPMTPPERTGARTAFAFAARGEDSPKTSRTSGSASVQTSSPAPQGLRTTSDRAASPSPTETLLQKKERFLREKAALLSTHETSGAKPSLFLSLQTPKKLITARNAAQQRYIELLQSHDIVFALGPAGTGKTYLAVAYAVHLLSARSITKLILTRPAVEAGEKLGFLPGDLIEKINPYLRPLYDALYDMLPQAKVAALCETGSIEIAPLAFMRGRTLHDACIILDEAQNTTREQMKMFLTRMGFGSKIIVTGDTSQIDLPSGAKGEQPLSGLVHATRILERVNGIALHSFSKSDVVRHPLVGEIVNAYDIAENRRTQA